MIKFDIHSAYHHISVRENRMVFGCDGSKQKSVEMASKIKQDHILSGFVPYVGKC